MYAVGGGFRNCIRESVYTISPNAFRQNAGQIMRIIRNNKFVVMGVTVKSRAVCKWLQ